jgi:hypothetical protein
VKSVIVKFDGRADLNKSLAKLTKDRVLVGVPNTTADREPESGEEASPINNATLAYIQNYGSAANNIPARPFMEPGIKNAKDKIASTYAKAAKDIFAHPGKDMSDAHQAVGVIAQTSIQQKITDGPFAPLADSTVAARGARGRSGDMTPLIDTGQLRRAITYVVREKS